MKLLFYEKKKKEKERRLTFLGVEEEEGLVKSQSVVIRKERTGLGFGKRLDEDDGKSYDEESQEKRQ